MFDPKQGREPLLKRVMTGCGANATSCSVSNGARFLVINGLGVTTTPSSPFVPRTKFYDIHLKHIFDMGNI